ncbi:MAG TPA: ATP-binding protein [Cytophagaceae bacterium]|jgi:PAS domain S-box-containing protein|nr:ATP-binding protein [Cytophagaceae bacterium]
MPRQREAFHCFNIHSRRFHEVFIHLQAVKEYTMNIFSDSNDIKSLDQAVKLLQESRKGFLQLFDNSPICMSMTTPQRRYKKVNHAFLEKFNYTEDEIIGHSSIEVGILDLEESAKVGQLIQEKGRLQNDYVRCIAKSGDVVHTLSSIELMEIDGEQYLVAFFIDITKIFEQQQIIEAQIQQLEAVNKELEAFSYSVSHDLMAPLRAINGYISILEENFNPLFDQEGKRVLAAVQKNAKKMGQLIDDLLSFARIGKKAIMKTELDMNNLVQEILNDFNYTTPHKADIHVNKLYPVKGDYALMKQVLINLLSNAIKYSSKKEHPVVEISSEVKNNQVMYTIKDNGQGFDMQYAHKLFGVFQRLHSSEEFEGTGVGLATVQRIINKHGGTISAKAEPGQGATFWFTLPNA